MPRPREEVGVQDRRQDRRRSASAVKSPGGTPGATWILVGSSDNYLHCVDAATSQPVWKLMTAGPINGTPVISTTGLIAFGGCDNLVHTVTYEGEPVSQTDVTGRIPTSIAMDGKLAFAGTHANDVVCVDTTPTLLAEAIHPSDHPSQPAIADERYVRPAAAALRSFRIARPADARDEHQLVERLRCDGGAGGEVRGPRCRAACPAAPPPRRRGPHRSRAAG